MSDSNEFKGKIWSQAAKFDSKSRPGYRTAWDCFLKTEQPVKTTTGYEHSGQRFISGRDKIRGTDLSAPYIVMAQ